jgi:uncharacterized membrane protein
MIRVSIALALGVLAAVAVGLARDEWHYSPAVGWITAAGVYLVLTWLVVLPLDPHQTEDHVRQRYEDGTPRLSHLIVLIASVASLGGVGYLLAAESGHDGHLGEALVGILSVIASWFAIHTTFMLRYAQLFYRGGAAGTVDFNQHDHYRPSYLDFAYLAFTVGMTYQVSDTNITSRQMRGAVLAQAMVSFLLGAVVLASTINLVLELAG